MLENGPRLIPSVIASVNATAADDDTDAWSEVLLPRFQGLNVEKRSRGPGPSCLVLVGIGEGWGNSTL